MRVCDDAASAVVFIVLIILVDAALMHLRPCGIFRCFIPSDGCPMYLVVASCACTRDRGAFAKLLAGYEFFDSAVTAAEPSDVTASTFICWLNDGEATEALASDVSEKIFSAA